MVFCGSQTRGAVVSINSTSEEVRSKNQYHSEIDFYPFPLIQLPRKSEAFLDDFRVRVRGVSINSTSEEVRSCILLGRDGLYTTFPLIQLPRKSEVLVDYAVLKNRKSFH